MDSHMFDNLWTGILLFGVAIGVVICGLILGGWFFVSFLVRHLHWQ